MQIQGTLRAINQLNKDGAAVISQSTQSVPKNRLCLLSRPRAELGAYACELVCYTRFFSQCLSFARHLSPSKNSEFIHKRKAGEKKRH